MLPSVVKSGNGNVTAAEIFVKENYGKTKMIYHIFSKANVNHVRESCYLPHIQLRQAP